MSTKDFLKKIKDEDIEYVDVRFTDTRGKLQHVTIVSDLVDEDFIEEGFMFDGSSIAGWKSIEASDMKLMLDTDTAYVDPFYAEKTLCVHCSIVEPDTGEAYDRDPRGTAQKAEAYLKSSGIGDTAYMGPEAEFFLFDNVKFSNTINKVSYEVDASDASWNTDTDYEMGNTGHRPGLKGGYFPVNPVDEAQDLRAEMLSTMKRLGHEGRQAPPRGGVLPARTWSDLRHPDASGGRAAKVQICDPQRGTCLRQIGNLHAQADLWR